MSKTSLTYSYKPGCISERSGSFESFKISLDPIQQPWASPLPDKSILLTITHSSVHCSSAVTLFFAPPTENLQVGSTTRTLFLLLCTEGRELSATARLTESLITDLQHQPSSAQHGIIAQLPYTSAASRQTHSQTSRELQQHALPFSLPRAVYQ
jgi:hypothetical protein